MHRLVGRQGFGGKGAAQVGMAARRPEGGRATPRPLAEPRKEGDEALAPREEDALAATGRAMATGARRATIVLG